MENNNKKRTNSRKRSASASTRTRKRPSTNKTTTKSTPKKTTINKNTKKNVEVKIDREVIKKVQKEPVVADFNNEIKKEPKKEVKLKFKRGKLLPKILLAVIVIIIVIIIALLTNKKNDSAIDENLETYQGKKIHIIDGDKVIEEENGSKTIETKKEDSKYIEADKKIKDKYKISDVTVKKSGTNTTITGKVRNEDSKYKNAYINVKFLNSNKEVVGSSSSLIDGLKENKEKDFALKIMGDFTKYKYVVEIEYVS